MGHPYTTSGPGSTLGLFAALIALACSPPDVLPGSSSTPSATAVAQVDSTTANGPEPRKPPTTTRLQPEDCPAVAPVSGRAFAGLVREKRYDELEPSFDTALAAYETDPRCEGALWKLHLHLEGRSPEWIALLSGWIDAKPESYAAYAIRGASRINAGFIARGTELDHLTPSEKMARMREHFDTASADIARSIQLQPRNPIPYGEIMGLFKASGSTGKMRDTAEALLEIHPSNYGVRRRWIQALDPRWGGSYGEMEEVSPSLRAPPSG